MKRNAIIFAASLAALLNACAPKKAAEGEKGGADASADAAVAQVSEHCVDAKASACFIEKEVDGRSIFYTTNDYNQTFLTHAGIVDTSIVMTPVSDAEYQTHLAETVSPRMIYAGKNVDVILDVVNEDGSPKAMPGRDDSANVLPALGLLKNAGMLKKFSGILKGGKGLSGAGGGLAKLKGLLGKGGKGSGMFSKILGGGRKSGGGVFKKIAIALGVGGLFGYVAGQPDMATKMSINARVSALAKPFDVPMNLSLGADKVEEEVTIE